METKLKIVKPLLGIILTFFFAFNSYANIKSYVKSTANESEEKISTLYPFIYFDLKTELFYDALSRSQLKEKRSFLYTQSDLNLDLNFNKTFSLHTNFGLQKITGATFTPLYLTNTDFKEEKAFEGNSLLTKELAMLFNFNKSKIYVGKISPKFGAGSERWSDTFYDTWYGISGTFLNQGYILDEKLGLLFSVDIMSLEDVKIKFQSAFFRNDNSRLYKKPFLKDREIEGLVVPNGFSRREAGSTTALKSHSINVEGFVGLTNRDVVAFSVGYKNQFSDTLDASEKGLSLSTQYTITFLDDLTLSIFGENTTIWNAFAIKDFRENYNTLSLSSSFAGFKFGIVQNYYRGKYQDKANNISLNEYFIGFEVPKTELGFFVARKNYSQKYEDLSGFSINIRYRIK